MRRLLLIGLLALAWSPARAASQFTPVQNVTQVVPAKGKAIDPFAGRTNSDAANSPVPATGTVTLTATTGVTSAVRDFSAYASVQVVISMSDSPSACARVPEILILAGATPESAMSSGAAPDTNSDFVTPTTGSSLVVSYIVNFMLPYAEFEITGYPGSGGATCTATVSVIGQPFSLGTVVFGPAPAGQFSSTIYPVLVGGVSGGTLASTPRTLVTDTSGNLSVGSGTAGTPATNVVTVQGIASGTAIPVTSTPAGTTTAIAPTQVAVDTTATGTSVYAGAVTTCVTTVQNACAVAITCGTGSVTSGGPGMILSAATSATTGDGGSETFHTGAAIKCIS